MKIVILEWFMCFKSAHFCEQRLRLVSALKHEKYGKMKKSRTWPMKKAIKDLVTFIAHFWSRFVSAKNVCWSRFRPCSTRPVHGPQRNRVPWPHYNVANKPFGHVCGHVSPHVSLYSWPRFGHVSFMFVATLHSNSWPRYIHVRSRFGHVQN